MTSRSFLRHHETAELALKVGGSIPCGLPTTNSGVQSGCFAPALCAGYMWLGSLPRWLPGGLRWGGLGFVVVDRRCSPEPPAPVDLALRFAHGGVLPVGCPCVPRHGLWEGDGDVA